MEYQRLLSVARSRVRTRPREVYQRWRWLLCALLLVLAFVGNAIGAAPLVTGPVGLAVRMGATQSETFPTNVKAFDPRVGAPLPTHRIVAVYGIVGGVDFNGAASSIDMLNAFMPKLRDLGNQYQQLDPSHPVELALDLVVNTIQPCSNFPKWCTSWADDQTLQQYVDYCQQHHLLLFFDLQLGTEPVADAISSHLMPYLSKYSFTELALDTEFHFPNTPQGYAEAAGYPCCLGSMGAPEINGAIDQLAQIEQQYHVPGKVVVIHEWNSGVLPDKDAIKLNPDVSIVLQSDGWGGVDGKLQDYSVFVQQQMIEYGGYKLFLRWPDGSEYDIPQQSPADVMKVFPQPLFVSYQ